MNNLIFNKAHYLLNKYLIRYDERSRFYDLSNVRPDLRSPKSPVLQFYSSVDNIGNYTPVLGIRKIIDVATDTWCIHDKNIDFDFINRNYSKVILGGAGLLHSCFEEFWQKLSTECKLPITIWGIGVCFPDGQNWQGVDNIHVTKVAKRADLINVRDRLTADYYDLQEADISPCPTIIYLEKFNKSKKTNGNVLFSSHEELVEKSETAIIRANIQASWHGKFFETDNIQRRFSGISKIISRYYCKSDLVVTTRLHGAIIAYGLKIPYIAIARDEKLRAFKKLYGNGFVIEDSKDIKDAVKNYKDIKIEKIETENVYKFGNLVKKWINS